MGKRLKFLLLAVLLYSWAGPALADYTLVLKNGRRITVQSYREEGRMIKFHGLGGDIGISKDQIQSIEKADPGEPTLDQTNFKGQQRSRRHLKGRRPWKRKKPKRKRNISRSSSNSPLS